MHGHLFGQRDVESLTLSFIRKYYLFVDFVALLVAFPRYFIHFSYLFGNYSVSGAEWSGWGPTLPLCRMHLRRVTDVVGWWVSG